MAGKDKFYPQISRFVLSRPLLEATARTLQIEGNFTVESILFWAGRVQGGIATVTDILVPKGSGVIQLPLHVGVNEAVIAALFDVLDPPDLVLLGQVHTHLACAFHSSSDDHGSLGTPGFLSVVVPNAARGGARQWDEWAFFECLGGSEFKLFRKEELARRVLIGLHDVTVHEIHA